MKKQSGEFYPSYYNKYGQDCLICGKQTKRPHNKYCSRKCMAESQRNGEKRNCEVCRKEFYATKYFQEKRKRLYCSRKCAYQACTQKYRGNGRWWTWVNNYVPCVTCGIPIRLKPSRVSTKLGNCCSKKCFSVAQSNYIRGDKHPMWRGGISRLPHTPDFNDELKDSIRERDKNTCAICGSVWKTTSHHRKYPVHHINYDKTDSKRVNLIVVCNICHARTNGRREEWTKILSPIAKQRERLRKITGLTCTMSSAPIRRKRLTI